MRHFKPVVVVSCAVALLAGCTSSDSTSSGKAPMSETAQAVDKVVQDNIAKRHLKAVIVRVTIDGKEVITKAYGESMTGVPATTDMHFRNGAVAISYVSTLLLKLVEQNKLSLDDKVSKWLPDLPHADEVTVGQLAQMTSGYVDYVLGNPDPPPLYENPFRQWTTDELLSYAVPRPLYYPPGTNWNYAHTNYVILGLLLEKLTGKPVNELLQDEVLGPLGLNNTTDPGPGTPVIPNPALHAFTSERKGWLNIPDSTSFYEESTFWNPSWTITRGAIQTTNIYDLSATAIAIGEGKLLSPESYKAMVSTDLRGKTQTLPTCPATCIPLGENYTYGLGIVITGDWLMQDPLFSGEAGAFAYLPAQKIGIALTLTFAPEAFNPDGSYTDATGANAADLVWREIGAVLAPNDPPPTNRK